MANIHEDAWKGILTADRLQGYLASADPSVIESRGGPKSITPLAAASSRGHLDVVQLLLANNANPNALSSHNRTPLFYATRSPVGRNRCSIVRALLEAGADINACSPDDGDMTPLMNAVAETRDKDLVRELVHRGASLTAKNTWGETAEMLARGTGMERELRQRQERKRSRVEIINLIVALVMLVIAYMNDIANRVMHKLYGISGAKYEEIAMDIPDPRSAVELRNNLATYVADTGLHKFFAPNDPFLQKLAKKAAALRDDPTTFFGAPENINRLTRLSLYQPVIYCDDSGSMRNDNRYTNQRELVSRIAAIATKIVPDNLGVELCFINAKASTNLSAGEIDAAMNEVTPRGGTPIGTNLRKKILEPLVYNVLSTGQRLQRPFLVCTITDGCPDPEPIETFKNAIVECRRELVNNGYEANAVMFSISQIGNAQSAIDFLDGLSGDREIKNVLYCTTDGLDAKYEELRANERRLEEWLLKMLTMPIMERNEG